MQAGKQFLRALGQSLMNGTERPRCRPQFSLRGLFLVTGGVALGAGYLRWRGFDSATAAELFLLAIVPVSVVLERMFDPPSSDYPRPSHRSIGSGIALLLACSLMTALPLGVWLVLAFCGLPTPPLALLPVMLWFAVPFLMRWSEAWLLIAPPLTFLLTSTFVATRSWPQPVPLRVPLWIATFGMLGVLLFVLDWSNATSDWGIAMTVAVFAGNLVATLVLVGLWWRWHNSARRWQVLLLAVLLHAWLFGLAMPATQGIAELLVRYDFDIRDVPEPVNPLEPQPAPPLSRQAWQRMQVGLTKAEVEALLGGQGAVILAWAALGPDGTEVRGQECWQYEWQTGRNVFDPHPQAYVVWFDDDGLVSDFREPIATEEP